MAYIDRNDINLRFGIKNVTRFADLDGDNNSDTITSVINAAIQVAEAKLEVQIRGSRLAWPLSVSGGSLYLIQEILSLWAGDILYRRRGFRNEEEDNKFAALVKRADMLMGQILTGAYDLDATLSFSGSTAPSTD